jgi:hypothetical protein
VQLFDKRGHEEKDGSGHVKGDGCRRESVNKKNSPKAVNVTETMDEVMRMGGKIDKMLKASYHPKAELVDLVAKLNQWVFSDGIR